MHLASSPSSAVPQTSCAVPITSPVGRDRAILCGRGKRGTGPSARRRPLPDCANRGGFLHSESTCLLLGNNIANFSLPLVTALADERHWPRVACHSNLCIRSCPAGILCTSDGGQRQTLPQLSHRRLCKCGKGVRPWMRPPNGRLSWCPPTFCSSASGHEAYVLSLGPRRLRRYRRLTTTSLPRDGSRRHGDRRCRRHRPPSPTSVTPTPAEWTRTQTTVSVHAASQRRCGLLLLLLFLGGSIVGVGVVGVG